MVAAQDVPCDAAVPDDAVWLLETARDHLRTLALDWPQRLAGPMDVPPDLAWLRGCPIPLAGPSPSDAPAAWLALARMSEWLERDILLESPARWLARFSVPAALASWCTEHSARLTPARCLAAWHPMADALRPPAASLEVLDDDPKRQDAGLRLLAEQIAADPVFVQRPSWRGQCAENGPWTRLRHRRNGTCLSASIWTRLTSRWLELVEIAAAVPPALQFGGTPLLARGAMALSGGQALAWCEMARGLLFHWVRLDAQGAIEDYRVLAPTEWNFHPEGTLAALVAQLKPQDTALARTLAAAFDPCVACSIVAPT